MVCDNCGKKMTKARKHVLSTNHNFCCRKCYFDFKRKNPKMFNKLKGKKQNRSYQDKLKKWAEIKVVRDETFRN